MQAGFAGWLKQNRVNCFLGLLFCAAAIPLAVRTAGLVARANLFPGVTFNEGWNAYYAHRAVTGIPLYGAPPNRLVINYPPLSFHVNGALAGASGDANFTGRMTSLAALFWVSLCAGFIAYRFSGELRAAAFAALFCLGWFVYFSPDAVAVNEPQLLAHALILTGVALYWAAPDSALMVAAACVVVCIGGFDKHNQLAFPLALTLDAMRRSRRLLAVWIGTAAAAVAIGFAITTRVDGPYFLQHLLTPRRYVIASGIIVSRVFFRMFLPALGAGAIWCVAKRRRPEVRFLLVALAAALVLGMFFTVGSGVTINVFYDTVIVLAIVAGLMVNDVARLPRAGTAIWYPIMLATVVLLSAGPVMSGVYSPAPSKAATMEADRTFREDIAYLKTKPDPAFCLDLLLCYEAGRALQFDPFYGRELMGRGLLDPHVLDKEFAARKYAVVQVYDSDIYFSPASWAVLRASYREERRNGGRVFYVPMEKAMVP